MPNGKQHLGDEGEELAVGHLRKIGYKIIERNFRTRTGEIDIIAKHKGQIVFAEVKTRQNCRFGHPKLAVTANKQRKISMVALTYLKKHYSLQTSARFDVVTVQSSQNGPIIDVIANAFELAYG
jgi:putative endonuclease